MDFLDSLKNIKKELCLQKAASDVKKAEAKSKQENKEEHKDNIEQKQAKANSQALDTNDIQKKPQNESLEEKEERLFQEFLDFLAKGK